MEHLNSKNIRIDIIKLGEALKVSPKDIVYYRKNSVQIVDLNDKFLSVRFTSPDKEELRKYVITLDEYKYLTNCLKKFKKY